MEVKKWTYDEFPNFTEEVEGAERLKTTGNEIGVAFHLLEMSPIKYIHVSYMCRDLRGWSRMYMVLVPYFQNWRQKGM